jgi:hypothetical protein
MEQAQYTNLMSHSECSIVEQKLKKRQILYRMNNYGTNLVAIF